MYLFLLMLYVFIWEWGPNPQALLKIKGVFTHGMFGSIKMNPGAIVLLVQFIKRISLNAAIWALVRTEQAGRDCWKDGSWFASKWTLVSLEWNMNAT